MSREGKRLGSSKMEQRVMRLNGRTRWCCPKRGRACAVGKVAEASSTARKEGTQAKALRLHGVFGEVEEGCLTRWINFLDVRRVKGWWSVSRVGCVLGVVLVVGYVCFRSRGGATRSV